MACVNLMGATVCSERLIETHRESVGERWCFYCRKRRDFDHVVKSPVEMSYYGPTPSIRCSSCDKPDADLFPGREREWVESGD